MRDKLSEDAAQLKILEGVDARRIAELEAEVAQLRRSGTHHRAVFDSASDFAIFTTDLCGEVTSWSTGAEKLLGWVEAEAIGQHARMIFTPPD